MIKNSCVTYLGALVIAASVAWSSPLAVNMEIDNHNLLLLEPIEVQVSVQNTGEKPVTITPLSVLGDNPNLVFHVATTAQTNQISKPILLLEQVEGNRQLKRINVSPGQTISESYIIGINWDSEDPIFYIGTNWLFCTAISVDGEEVQSNMQKIIVRTPQNQNEIEVQALMGGRDTLRSLYAPDYLLLVNHPDEIVTAMRRLAMTDQCVAKRASQALSVWEKYEQDAREGRAPGLKAKGFDRLGVYHRQ